MVREPGRPPTGTNLSRLSGTIVGPLDGRTLTEGPMTRPVSGAILSMLVPGTTRLWTLGTLLTHLATAAPFGVRATPSDGGDT
jgi:hypothetical protein